eukprot:PLAT13999.3.p1 GENE.PLAT13999.3~~PLAT13999.3.p1  ORF type:complete len:1021 (+),score=538.34 PLAT13999.3:458-3064(+)
MADSDDDGLGGCRAGLPCAHKLAAGQANVTAQTHAASALLEADTVNSYFQALRLVVSDDLLRTALSSRAVPGVDADALSHGQLLAQLSIQLTAEEKCADLVAGVDGGRRPTRLNAAVIIDALRLVSLNIAAQTNSAAIMLCAQAKDAWQAVRAALGVTAQLTTMEVRATLLQLQADSSGDELTALRRLAALQAAADAEEQARAAAVLRGHVQLAAGAVWSISAASAALLLSSARLQLQQRAAVTLSGHGSLLALRGYGDSPLAGLLVVRDGARLEASALRLCGSLLAMHDASVVLSQRLSCASGGCYNAMAATLCGDDDDGAGGDADSSSQPRPELYAAVEEAEMVAAELGGEPTVATTAAFLSAARVAEVTLSDGSSELVGDVDDLAALLSAAHAVLLDRALCRRLLNKPAGSHLFSFEVSAAVIFNDFALSDRRSNLRLCAAMGAAQSALGGRAAAARIDWTALELMARERELRLPLTQPGAERQAALLTLVEQDELRLEALRRTAAELLLSRAGSHVSVLSGSSLSMSGHVVLGGHLSVSGHSAAVQWSGQQQQQQQQQGTAGEAAEAAAAEVAETAYGLAGAEGELLPPNGQLTLTAGGSLRAAGRALASVEVGANCTVHVDSSASLAGDVLLHRGGTLLFRLAGGAAQAAQGSQEWDELHVDGSLLLALDATDTQLGGAAMIQLVTVNGSFLAQQSVNYTLLSASATPTAAAPSPSAFAAASAAALQAAVQLQFNRSAMPAPYFVVAADGGSLQLRVDTPDDWLPPGTYIPPEQPPEKPAVLDLAAFFSGPGGWAALVVLMLVIFGSAALLAVLRRSQLKRAELKARSKEQSSAAQATMVRRSSVLHLGAGARRAAAARARPR